MSDTKAARCAALNDKLRCTGTGGRIMVTSGIQALGVDVVPAILAAVGRFDAFNQDNDPYGEHDCAVLDVAGHRIVFKIDPYDRSLNMHSPDKTDPSVTIRVMTVMLASEY
jgi:hypothetical protein